MRAAAAAIAVTGLLACSNGQVPLPNATAVVGATHLALARASYCWSTPGRTECADAADPDTLIQTGHLKPVSAQQGSHVSVTFDRNPQKVETELLWPSKTLPIPQAGPNFDLPSAPGRYVFVATGIWPEGDVGFFLPVDVV